MKHLTRITALLLAVALIGGGTSLLATDEISKLEGKMNCTACHDKAGSRLLTDQGKYYETQRTLEGYAELSKTFGRCTACHVRKPGSARLTKTGKQLASVVADMDDLREWLTQQHPVTPKAP